MWLDRNRDHTSPSVQNEMLLLIVNSITRAICSNVRKSQPLMFAVMVNGIRDITSTVEVFLGFYEAVETTGRNIAAIIKDVLLRLQLPIEFLRGQTYDGAANMAGVYNAAQAIIRRDQPLAL